MTLNMEELMNLRDRKRAESLAVPEKRPKWLLWRDTQHCKESSAEN